MQDPQISRGSENVPECLKLNARIFGKIGDSDANKKYSDEALWKSRAEHGLLLMATIESEPVGFCLSYSREAGCWHIWLAGVISEHRGKGIWRQMLHETIKFAESIGFRMLSITTIRETFPNMYRSLMREGFSQADAAASAKVRMVRNIGVPQNH